MKKFTRIFSAVLALCLAAAVCLPVRAAGAQDCGAKLLAITFDDGPGQYTGALLDGLADGLTLDELSWEKTEWDEEYGMFVRRGTARCTAYFVATADEESAVLTDFILKGVMQ